MQILNDTTVAVCVKDLYPLAKAGHWETEKAGCGVARKSSLIIRKSEDLLWYCYINVVFLFAYLQINCDACRKTAVAILKYKLLRLFIISQKPGGCL